MEDVSDVVFGGTPMDDGLCFVWTVAGPWLVQLEEDTRRDERVDRVSGASSMTLERTGDEKALLLPMVRMQSR